MTKKLVDVWKALLVRADMTFLCWGTFLQVEGGRVETRNGHVVSRLRLRKTSDGYSADKSSLSPPTLHFASGINTRVAEVRRSGKSARILTLGITARGTKANQPEYEFAYIIGIDLERSSKEQRES